LDIHLNHIYSFYGRPPQHIAKGFCVNFLCVRVWVEGAIFGQRVTTDSGMVIEPCSSCLLREGHGESQYIPETIYGDIMSQHRKCPSGWFKGNHTACLAPRLARHRCVVPDVASPINENLSRRK